MFIFIGDGTAVVLGSIFFGGVVYSWQHGRIPPYHDSTFIHCNTGENENAIRSRGVSCHGVFDAVFFLKYFVTFM